MSDHDQPTVRVVTRRLLRQLQMTTVFGNPGTTEVPFLTDWPDDFRYVLGLQESVVVGMADAYATALGRPALVNLHSAGGVGHGLGAVFTAYRNRTPLVVLAGQQVRSLLPHDPFLGALDAPEFPRPYVKWSVEPARASDVPTALLRAYRIAVQPPRGPTFVSVPADDWDEPGEPGTVPAALPPRAPDEAAMRELAESLRRCERPAFIVGPAVAEDGVVNDVVTLAEHAKAAVWAAPMSARAAFPETHPYFQGFLRPEQRLLADDLGDFDLVVVLGAPAFTYHVFRGAVSRPLPPMYVLSDDPEILARMPHGQGIGSDVGPAVRALVSKLPESRRAQPPVWTRPELPALSERPTASHVVDAVSEVLPSDAVVVEEAPSHRPAIQEFLPIDAPRQELFTVASGTLGYGVSAAVGAALAVPHRRVVAILGDGSSMYGIQALWTAVRESAPVTFLVLDNEGYSAVRVLGGDVGDKLPGVDLGGIDFVSVAVGMGCVARRIEDLARLRTELVVALTRPGPTLLHIPIGGAAPRMY